MEVAGEHGLTLDDLTDFVLGTDIEDARAVLLSDAPAAQRTRAADAFILVVTSLIRQGRIAAEDVAERLGVAGQIQVEIA